MRRCAGGDGVQRLRVSTSYDAKTRMWERKLRYSGDNVTSLQDMSSYISLEPSRTCNAPVTVGDNEIENGETKSVQSERYRDKSVG